MNNSDIIAALSLAITVIIFLVQTDDGLLKLKIRSYERWVIGIVMLSIILLVNYQIFSRHNITFYFTFKGMFLKPDEWALIIFLLLIAIILYRIFTPRIFNNDSKIILGLIDKYRQQKKWEKLQNLLVQVMDLEEFDKSYADHLNDTIFNDHHIIEHFASDFPELLINFSQKYKNASIKYGEHFFYILNGLFSDKSNPIYAEIRYYHNEIEKNIFLDDNSDIRYNDGFTFDKQKDYRTVQPIISWLTSILNSSRTNFKEEISYFLAQYKQHSIEKNNKQIYSSKEIERILSRDPALNSLKLFKIMLVEFSLNNKRAIMQIDEALLLFYSAWEFVIGSTKHQSVNKVALNNDQFTVNEYFIKYLFHGYISIFLILRYTWPSRASTINKEHDSSSWPIKQLFAKMEGLIGSEGIVSQKSKLYYTEELFSLYFEIDEYFEDNEKESKHVCKILLLYIRESLESSPYGDVRLIRKTFNEACNSFDFYKYDSLMNLQRKKDFYQSLLPYTSDHKWRITDEP